MSICDKISEDVTLILDKFSLFLVKFSISFNNIKEEDK